MPKNVADLHDKILINFVRTGAKKFTDGQIKGFIV